LRRDERACHATCGEHRATNASTFTPLGSAP
jgi:hypothetical protein